MMHESEWLPWILTKADMLRICNEFNLSVDGFRKGSLSSRSDEALRNLITEAMKKGIGAKRAIKGKILIPFFYAQISERVLKENSKYIEFSFEELISELEMEYNLRPYEKLSLIYELHKEKYVDNVAIFCANIKGNNDILKGVSSLSDEDIVNKTIDQLQNENSYPIQSDYIEFFVNCGEQERWEKTLFSFQENKSERVKFTWALGLNGLERLMALVCLLPYDTRLESVVYFLYNEQKEKKTQEIYEKTIQEVAIASGTAQQLATQLEHTIEDNTRLNLEISDKKDTEDKLNERIVRYEHIINAKEEELKEIKQANLNFQKSHELIYELTPDTDDVIIVTDKTGSIINQLFNGNIYSKNFLLKAKEKGTTTTLKTKIWFIDRSTFTNTREWIEIKNFLNQNGFQYDEYSDYVQLIKLYINLFN